MSCYSVPMNPLRVLAIETSCDETAVSLLEQTVTASGETVITVLGNALSSQIDIHAQYGGVFPALAKRAHAEHIIPLLMDCLEQADMLIPHNTDKQPVVLSSEIEQILSALDAKEATLKTHISAFFSTYQAPAISHIAVTVGPGLAPALWVGVNTATTLAQVWSIQAQRTIPVIPINHMEGHVVTATYQQAADKKTYTRTAMQLPALALLVSGGHTELIHIEQLGIYIKIGQTRDDAIGEAFDKVARMLSLTYPGGPKVSALAAQFRESGITQIITLPQPMLHSGDYDFSHSGIKTAALYTIRDLTEQNTRELTDTEKMMIACAFEDAAIAVLVHKTVRACQEYHSGTVIVGGGVAGNSYLRTQLTTVIAAKIPHCTVLFPELWLATDNAIMIGLAAMGQLLAGTAQTPEISTIVADGNLSL